jgi:hypothetical protein
MYIERAQRKHSSSWHAHISRELNSTGEAGVDARDQTFINWQKIIWG